MTMWSWRIILSVATLALTVVSGSDAIGAEPRAHWRFSEDMRLADHDFTPGVTTDTTDIDGKQVPLTHEVLCTKKWGKDVPHVTQSMKKHACELYGANTCPSLELWELDHLISRELGGADDEKNLWPQPIKQARIKDRIETLLHKKVCNNEMILQEAQKGIADDWTQYIKFLPAH